MAAVACVSVPVQVADVAQGVVNIISDTATAGQTFEFMGYVSPCRNWSVSSERSQ